MATVTKTVLKTYFNAGDIPTEGQYVDLIDSQFGLGETGTQIIQGTVSASAAEFEQMTIKKLHLPSNGVGSMKVGTTFNVGKTLEAFGSLNLNILYKSGSTTIVDSGSFSASGDLTIRHIVASGHITASVGSNISASATSVITAQDVTLDRQLTSARVSASGYIVGQNITASGNMSASGAIFSDSHISASGNITASNAFFSNDITASGYISASGHITASSIYSRGSVSASGLLTVDTLTIGATYNNTSFNFDDNTFTNNNKAFSITTTLPDISAGTYCSDTTVTNSSVTTNSVIIASANREVSVVCHSIAAESFKFRVTGFESDFQEASTRINFIIL